MTSPDNPTPSTPGESGASRLGASEAEPVDRPPRSYFQLLPRRTLMKAFWLVVLLFGIVTFQKNSEKFARMFTNTFAPPTPIPGDGPARDTKGPR
jgi:hypothetical protein